MKPVSEKLSVRFEDDPFEPRLILAGENPALRRLQNRLRTLAEEQPSVAEISQPELLDSKDVRLIAHIDPRASGLKFVSRGDPSSFIWSVSISDLVRYADQIEGLIQSKASGHHYLECEDGLDEVTLIVSRGE